MAKPDTKSILDMGRGAFKERVDYEMKRVIDNIMDTNTRADKKRTLTVTLTFTPDADRKQVDVDVVAKSKLEPTNAVKTALYITGDKNGELTALEMVPQIPGQQFMDGGEQEEPAKLRIIS